MSHKNFLVAKQIVFGYYTLLDKSGDKLAKQFCVSDYYTLHDKS